MKIQIDRSIVEEIQETTHEFKSLLNSTIGQFGVRHPEPEGPASFKAGDHFETKIYKVVVTDSEFHIEINRRFLKDGIRLYRKAFPVIVPVIGSFVGAIKVLGTYISGFTEKWSEEKEDKTKPTKQVAEDVKSFCGMAVDFVCTTVGIEQPYGESRLVQVVQFPDLKESLPNNSMFGIRTVGNHNVKDMLVCGDSLVEFLESDDKYLEDGTGITYIREKNGDFTIRTVDDSKYPVSSSIVISAETMTKVLRAIDRLSLQLETKLMG